MCFFGPAIAIEFGNSMIPFGTIGGAVSRWA